MAAKKRVGAVVLTEDSSRPRPPCMEINFQGEVSAVGAINDCISAAVSHAQAKLKAVVATRFTVVFQVHCCWAVIAMVPPILVADSFVPICGEIATEPAPSAIDAWASLHISTVTPQAKPPIDETGRTSSNLSLHELEHRSSLWGGGRSTGEVFNSLPRILAAQLEPDGNGRRSTSRPTSAGSARRPSSANRRPASASRARRELFKLADRDNKGAISAEGMHEWLSMQSPTPFSEIKKLLDAVNHPQSQPFGPGIFGDVLALLQRANPKRWAIENLTVFAIPKPKLDSQLNVDARELKEILCPGQAHKPKLEVFSPFSPLEKVSNSFGDTPTFGTEHVINDHVTLPTPQVFINTTRRPSTVPKDNAVRTSKNLKRALTSQHSFKYCTTNSIAHSHSQPTIGRSQSPGQHDENSAKFLPLHFRQTSLVENFEFLPEAGVSAVEFPTNQDASDSNRGGAQVTRAGPPWPSDPNHMTRSAFQSLKVLERPESAVLVTNSAVAEPFSSATTKPTKQARIRRHDNSMGSVGEGSIVVSSLLASGFSELFTPPTRLPDGLLEPISLAGGKPGFISHPERRLEEDGTNQALQRLEEVEARLIHELRGEDAVGKETKISQLPAYAADVRFYQKATVLEGRNSATRERTRHRPTRIPGLNKAAASEARAPRAHSGDPARQR